EGPRVGRTEKAVRRITSRLSPFSRTAEAHRAIRSAILFEVDARRAAREAEGGAKVASGDGIVVMLTSATQREGKTTTAANLAVVFAEAGATVLVVNCDFRRPELHRYFGVEDVPGRVLDTEVPGLKIAMGADAGPHARPAQVIEAQRQLISVARRNFDIVLLDTAPLLATNETIAVETTVVLSEPTSDVVPNGAPNGAPKGANGTSAKRGNGAASSTASPASPDEPPALRWND